MISIDFLYAAAALRVLAIALVSIYLILVIVGAAALWVTLIELALGSDRINEPASRANQREDEQPTSETGH